ncbi:unnamed protein product [Symbiodinium sp. KB8]|nr:unnamed protein product [Symbiodinium sp. KB8]
MQGTWALGWWAVLSPLLGILGVHIAAWLLAVFVESRTLSTLADPTSPWHLQGQASRFSLCGQLALQYQRVVHRGKDRDVPGIRDRQRIGGAVVAGAILFLSLGVLLPVLKAAGVAGLTWAGAFVPIFVLLGLLWLAAPWLLDTDDTEEAAAASTCCFCCVSLPTICTLAMVAARFDGSSPDISVADMIIPIAIVLGVLVCFACMMTVLLAHEGELGGNPAGQRVFSCFCLCFCTVVGGLTSTLGLLAAVDAGNLPAVGVLYPETHTFNASSLPPGVNATGNATTVDVTTWEEGDVSWWLLLLPAMVMLAYLSVLACAASCLGWLVQRMKVPRFYRRPTHSLPHEMTEHV